MKQVFKAHGVQIPKVKLLSETEEKALASRSLAGDLEARNELIVRNLPLVHAVVCRYLEGKLGFDNRFQFDDLFQTAVFGLIRAAELYDPSRNVRFSTYAFRAIRSHLIPRRQPKRVKLTLISHFIGEHEIAYPCSLAMEHDEATSRLLGIAMTNANLSDLEKHVMNQLYFNGNGEAVSLRKIGKKIGRTAAGVQCIEQRALKKLRKNLEQIGITEEDLL